jgi:hypothetical protein
MGHGGIRSARSARSDLLRLDSEESDLVGRRDLDLLAAQQAVK